MIWLWRGKILIPLLLLTAVTASARPVEPPRSFALYGADRALETARRTNRLADWEAALALLARARDESVTLDGTAADVGYGERLAEARRALADDPAAAAMFDRLPGGDRGRLPEALRQRVRLDAAGAFAAEARFAGGEPAMFYARARFPIRLTIRSQHGARRCGRDASDGYAFCQWHPAADERVRVVVQALTPAGRTGEFEMFTN